MFDFRGWQIRLKLRWEYFLLHRGFKKQEKFADNILAWFEKKGWQYAYTFHGSLEDVKKEIESEFVNLQKVSPKETH